jgi:hypothetical protein
MLEKEVWTDEDFDIMGWHDSRLYSFSMPNEKFEFALDIDYIFKWEKSGDQYLGFWVSASDIVFHNVSDFRIEIDQGQALLCFIMDLTRKNSRLSPNGKCTLWDYEIELDTGAISFTSTGFIQRLKHQPILSETQSLDNR